MGESFELGSPSSSILDYRFGWRWLLPACDGDLTASVGLSVVEHQWWGQTQSLTLVSSKADRVDGYLIALDAIDPAGIANHINNAKPRWLCAWGAGTDVSRLRSSLHGFGAVREYALLPAGQPRVVVPLSSAKNASAGLRLHRPGRWRVRLGLLVARWFARVGHFGLLRRRVLVIATREEGIVSRGAVKAGLNTSNLSERADYALYLGTPAENRKTVILPLGGLRQVILKQGTSPIAKAALLNEAAALQALSLAPLAAQVPVLDDVGERVDLLVLQQEYRARHWMSEAGMRRATVDFLGKLSREGRNAKPLVEVLNRSGLMTSDEARTKGRMSYARVRSHLDILATAGTMVWGHRSHGDFAPWNCAWTAKGFFVYDWEDSQPWGVALGDAFYYAISPALHVESKPNPGFVMNKALMLAAQVVKCSDFRSVDINLYFAFWVLAKCETHSFYDHILDIFYFGENA